MANGCRPDTDSRPYLTPLYSTGGALARQEIGLLLLKRVVDKLQDDAVSRSIVSLKDEESAVFEIGVESASRIRASLGVPGNV